MLPTQRVQGGLLTYDNIATTQEALPHGSTPKRDILEPVS